jgi:hypothetical protein
VNNKLFSLLRPKKVDDGSASLSHVCDKGNQCTSGKGVPLTITTNSLELLASSCILRIKSMDMSAKPR